MKQSVHVFTIGVVFVATNIIKQFTSKSESEHSSQSHTSNYDIYTQKGGRRNVIIIGSTIAGLSTAITLKERGHNVTVLERDTIRKQCQALSIQSEFFEVMSDLKSNDLDVSISLLALEVNPINLTDVLFAGSNTILHKLQYDENYSIGYRQSCALDIATNRNQFNMAKAKYPHIDIFYDCPTTGATLTNKQTRLLHPRISRNIYGSVLYPRCATANPYKTMAALQDKCVKLGVNICENLEVYNVIRDNNQWTVNTRFFNQKLIYNEGENDINLSPIIEQFQGDTLVLASDCLIQSVDSIFPDCDSKYFPIVPVLGQMWATPTYLELQTMFGISVNKLPRLNFMIKSTDSSIYCNKDESNPLNGLSVVSEVMLNEHKSRHLFLKQCLDGRFIVAGNRTVEPYKPVGSDDGLSQLIEIMTLETRQKAIEVFPIIAIFPLHKQLSGIMSVSSDGHPIIGKVPGVENVYVISGLGMSEFGKGPMAGTLTGIFIDEGPNSISAKILDQASPSRFAAQTE